TALAKLAELPKTADEAKALGATVSADQVPQLLAFLVGMKKRVKLTSRKITGKGPRSIAVIGDKVYLGMYFSDTIVSVDTSARTPKVKEFVALGPTPEMTPARRGELHWHDATLCFQHWQSCASCHPDARSDDLNWDLLNDGMGNPKNAKSLLFSIETPPAMWHGVRKDAETAIRTGFQYILFSSQPEECYLDIEEYVKSLQPYPSPHLVNGELSDAAKRGKAIFEDEKIGCNKCHFGEYYTDMQMHDVGSKAEYDHQDEFDTPTLRELWRTPPYMHDGRYVTLKEIFVDGHHGDVLGDIDSLSEDQINDLIEYIQSL
ncbi:MAG: c-type cytochrome, partial [Thermoguttaceae bacterium]|nr:c-type cytochrome [Thermoguttaceae bacterium]